MQSKASIWFIDENVDGSTSYFRFVGDHADVIAALEQRAYVCLGQKDPTNLPKLKIDEEFDSIQATARAMDGGTIRSYFCEATDVNMLSELPAERGGIGEW